MAKKILITPRSVTRDGHPALARLSEAGYELLRPTPGEQPEETILTKTLPGCVGYLAGVEPITANVLESAKALKVISRNGTGIDNIDLEAADRCGIQILRAEGANARGVAELAIGLMLALVRSIPFSDSQMKQTLWQRRKGVELEGRCLGLVGCGKIGQHVARMASGLGMKVIAFDPYPDQSLTASLPNIFSYVSLDEVFSQSHIISLHCPAAPDKRPLIDTTRINSMRNGVYLVNTARGELLDDEAVLHALTDGKIAGLATDSFRNEPPGNNPLVLHERAIATPHIGAFTSESVDRAIDTAVDQLLVALQHTGL